MSERLHPRRRALQRALGAAGLTVARPRAGSASPTSNPIRVDTSTALQNAVSAANQRSTPTTILLAPGIYRLQRTLNVTRPDLTIASDGEPAEKVVIEGDAMSANAKIGNLIRVAASGFCARNLTLRQCGQHLIQVAGESGAHGARLEGCVLMNAFEQLFKVSYDARTPSVSADDGSIEDCTFLYSAGIGPQWYIGGIDVHAGKRWTVRRNVFRSIISPNREIAEFAIHFWSDSADALVEQNLIVNCDRGIGFGLAGRGNQRGQIRNNVVIHNGKGTFADVAIYLEKSPDSVVCHNTVLMAHHYPNAIEYRFKETTGVLIANNLTNRKIMSRHGAQARTIENVVTAKPTWFVAPNQENLRLSALGLAYVATAGLRLQDVKTDFDGNPRSDTSTTIGAYHRN